MHNAAVSGRNIVAVRAQRATWRPGYAAPGLGHLQICHIWHTLHPVSPKDKPLVWLHGNVKTPPFSAASRLEAGFLLRRLQRGEKLSLPQSRPMPSIGTHCHELRITDRDKIWRIVYRIDPDSIVIADVFVKKTEATPKNVIDVCKSRFRMYDDASK